jgi:hypothetical protein
MGMVWAWAAAAAGRVNRKSKEYCGDIKIEFIYDMKLAVQGCLL